MDKKQYRKENLKFTCKFLGEFEIEYKDSEDFGEGSACVIDKKGRIHWLDNFMRIEGKKSSFHGNHVTSYFSAYTCIVSDCGQSLKLFYLYW